MKKFILSGLIGLLAVAMAGTPVALRAQTSTNMSAAEKKAIAQKKAGVEKKEAPKSLPFRGKVKTIDNSAKTLAVGKETFQITSETKITKSGKPATLNDGAEGDQVAGSYHKDADGKLTASMVRFGPKSPGDVSSESKTNKP
jgi:uncharacterized protein (UPF0333 family)